MTDDVKRLESELELAKALEKLERAREKMHADRKDKRAHTAFRNASEEVAKLRSAHRTKFPTTPSGEGDAVATVDTVHASAKAEEPR